MISIVNCKFSNKMLQSDCCFVLGCWVQCHVLCQKWCCACWSRWNTESYAACCCTGDTQLGSVNFTSTKFQKTRNVDQCPTWWPPSRIWVAPSVQRRKVWLTPTTRVPCSNAAKTRNPLKFAGVPQTRQHISAVSRPKFTIVWGHVE